MSKRKCMHRASSLLDIKKGDRIVVLDRSVFAPVIRIGYVDSFSHSGDMVYVDYSWRGNREGSMWLREGPSYWSLTMLQEGFVEIYKTNMSLKQCQARAVKLHPNWNWLKGVL